MITPKALLNNTVDRPRGARRLRPPSARCDRHCSAATTMMIADHAIRHGCIGQSRPRLGSGLERAAVIASPQHMIDHFHNRIRCCEAIIDGADT